MSSWLGDFTTPRNRKIFEATYTAGYDGYTIFYRGYSIGGAGIIGKPKRRSLKQLHSYARTAEEEIGKLVDGDGQAGFLTQIAEINRRDIS